MPNTPCTKHNRLNKDSDTPLMDSLEKNAFEKVHPAETQSVISKLEVPAKHGNENSEAAGKKIGAGRHLVKKWQRYAPWWEEYINHARLVLQEEMDAELTALVHKVTDQLKDRLDNGDWSRNSKGNRIRNPLKARDLSHIFDTLFKDRALIRGDATSNVQRVSTESQLETIKDFFTDWGKKEITAEVIDGEVIDEDVSIRD